MVTRSNLHAEFRVLGMSARLSNGMDIKLMKAGGTALEYNVIGGVLDFYFLAGSTSDPTAVARQYAEVAGTPAEVPYWSFGLHQCRFGYKGKYGFLMPSFNTESAIMVTAQTAVSLSDQSIHDVN
ncbi:hypothetical protein H0H87_000815 [Tephrocybe sp. NHM501043]|nr:hypothetical protein H0H87_000815 [Tephrocybe sp. NHM501043]